MLQNKVIFAEVYAYVCDVRLFGLTLGLDIATSYISIENKTQQQSKLKCFTIVGPQSFHGCRPHVKWQAGTEHLNLNRFETYFPYSSLCLLFLILQLLPLFKVAYPIGPFLFKARPIWRDLNIA